MDVLELARQVKFARASSLHATHLFTLECKRPEQSGLTLCESPAVLLEALAPESVPLRSSCYAILTYSIRLSGGDRQVEQAPWERRAQQVHPLWRHLGRQRH